MGDWAGSIYFGGREGISRLIDVELEELRVLYAEKPARKTNLTSSHLAISIIFLRVPT